MNIHFTPEFRNRVLNSPTQSPEAAGSDPASKDDWSIAQCAQALYRRKKLLVGIASLGLLTAALVSLLQPRWYRSQASLELQRFNENYLDFRDIYPNAAPGADGDVYLETQAEILQEDTLIEQVVRRLHLENRPEIHSLHSRFRRGASAGHPDAGVRNATQALKRNIEVTYTRGSRVLRIAAESRDPRLAADIANTLALVFIEQNVDMRQEAARQTYAALNSQLTELRNRLGRSESRHSPFPPAGRGATRSELYSSRQFYRAMAERADEAALASTMPQSNIRLISAARPATRPSKPNIPLNFAIGSFGGVLLAAGWVLLREQTNSALRVPGEAGTYLAVPELGAIPEAAEHNFWLIRSRNSGGPPVERAALEQRFSRVSEAFRATLASILSSGGGADTSRLLVVTSAQPMEGKTTVVSNLGIALAEISGRVLLVDGDMRRPRLHKVFDQPNSWGLSDVLREKNAIEDLPVEALVKKTAIPHLYLLPSGASVDNVFSLLYSGRLERLLPRFREEFDYVLIDAPPCLEFADARIMARYAEKLLLVVRADYTGRQTTQTAIRRLLLDGTSVMGVILNRWNPAFNDGYTYGYRNTLVHQDA